jgi:uncharacterized protein YjbI with pentapeptide repeats
MDLSQSQLRDVTFADCKLDDTNLRLAKLISVRFGDSVLVTADFGAAQLEQVAFADCDLRAADLSNARCAQVDLRTARLDGLKGIGSLRGATIGVDQLVGLAPGLAHALGLTVADDDRP